MEIYGNFMGKLWEPHGNFLETSWKPNENVIDFSWKFIGNLMEISWKSYFNLMENSTWFLETFSEISYNSKDLLKLPEHSQSLSPHSHVISCLLFSDKMFTKADLK